MNEAPEKSATLQTTFLINREVWERFGKIAARNQRSRGAEVRALILEAIAEDEAQRS